MKKYFIGMMVLLFIVSCSNDKKIEPIPGKIELVFEPYIGFVPLELYTKKYLSPANDTFEVQNFKFFVHFQSISNETSTIKWKENYKLISFDSEKTQNSLTLENVTVGSYTDMKFDIGVDSINNHTTVHLGELAPGSGMTWDWNTGYKFLLLEGTFATNTTSGALVFHIGEDKNYKSMKFNFSSPLIISPNKTTQIRVKVDINAMFDAPHLIDFDVVNEAMQNADADKIAENFAEGMFSISQINYKND